MKEALATLEIRRKSLFDFPNGARGHWGDYADAAWKNRIAKLYESHTIKAADIDVATLYTNELIPGINAFDADAVTKQAESLK
jgi:NitT/TauT family transport system substrate-binding protein